MKYRILIDSINTDLNKGEEFEVLSVNGDHGDSSMLIDSSSEFSPINVSIDILNFCERLD